MARCWEQRGCDGDLLENCPHEQEFKDRCPTKCAFARCELPTHEPTDDPALIWDPTVDRSHAIREECLFCSHFLTKGPRIGEGDDG